MLHGKYASHIRERSTMQRQFWYLTSGITTLLLFALYGCGFTSDTGGDNANSDTATNGSVSISINRTMYAPTDTVEVSVTNHLQTSIFAYDTRASCTILGLQMQVNGSWQDTQVARCSLGRPAMLVEILPGKVFTATIRAGSQGVSQAAFPSGSYRLILTYSTSATRSPQQTSQSTITLYSATFHVTSST